MGHKTCELCKTRSSSKWKTVTLTVSQDLLDIFGIQMSLGQFICNACQLKISKQRKNRALVLDFDESKHLTVPLRENKFVTKSNTLKKSRLENLFSVLETELKA